MRCWNRLRGLLSRGFNAASGKCAALLPGGDTSLGGKKEQKSGRDSQRNNLVLRTSTGSSADQKTQGVSQLWKHVSN